MNKYDLKDHEGHKSSIIKSQIHCEKDLESVSQQGYTQML